MKKQSVTREDIEWALKRATQSYEGWCDRWQFWSANGLTDAQLKDAITRSFGIEGGYGGPGNPSYWYKGGANPKFWVSRSYTNTRDKPTLTGMKLIKAVRALYSIPDPGDVQLKLL